MNLNERAFGIVVVFLGVALLMVIAFMGVLALNELAIPDPLQIALGGLIPGLLGLLAKTPNQPPPGGGA